MENSKPLIVVVIAIYNFITGLVSVWFGLVGVFLFPFIPDMQIEMAESYFQFILGIGLLTSSYGLWTRQSWSKGATILVLLVPALLTPLWISETNAVVVNQLIVLGSVLDVFLLLMLWNKKVDDWLQE